MAGSRGLTNARKAKKDEFYTQRSVIEDELFYYKKHFKDKVVLCNCDDPTISEFSKFFKENFEEYGLKKLITTCYKNANVNLFSEHTNSKGCSWVYYGNGKKDTNKLKGDGDFRSKECKELLEEADIVVTNPPFSLFREYIAQLIDYNKKFLIIGNLNAVTYKEVFPLIKDKKIWFGPSISSGDRKFYVPDDYPLNAAGCGEEEDGKHFIRVKGVRWFTNLDHKKRHEELILYKKYSPEEYPKYDNYDAIEVGLTAEIPRDYDGVMGVPITFLDKYNPEQFEIIDLTTPRGIINGKTKYARILIRKK
ncbi:MAG: adenine-specific methyltransferase EcoRI family protein [Bacteroidales bacterium]|nr:adenine-specific methyltransferase EcoRI family protein [Bacteroidales bacterium]